MENRFLSRGKRKDNGEWVEGYLIVDEKGDLRNKYNVGLYCSGCGQKLDWGDEE